jgi:hypothetical protein
MCCRVARRTLRLALSALLFSVPPVPIRAAEPALLVAPTLDFGSYVGGTMNDTITSIQLAPTGEYVVGGRSDQASWSYDRGTNYGGWVGRYGPDRHPIFTRGFYIELGRCGINAVATDALGNVYAVGFTGPSTRGGTSRYPTMNPIQDQVRGASDAVVTKLSPTGELLYSTYLGGSGDENAIGVAVDAAGNAFVLGTTTSMDFPQASPLPGTSGGGAFLVKLDPTGTTLLASRLLDGGAAALALDAAGNPVVAGATSATGLPGVGGYRTTSSGGGDGFVLDVRSDLDAVLASTFLGGSGTDAITGLAIAPGGDVAVTGTTASTDFPTQAAWAASRTTDHDGFATRLAPDLSRLVFSTYLGPMGGAGVAVDSSGAIHVTGQGVTALGLTAAGAFRYSFGNRTGAAIAADAAGAAWVGGTTDSDLLETTPDGSGWRAIRQECYSVIDCPRYMREPFDAFLQRIDPSRVPSPALDEHAAGTSYEGTWMTRSGTDLAGGQALFTDEAGARAEIAFEGTGIQVFGRRDPTTGPLDVRLESSDPLVHRVYQVPPRFVGLQSTTAPLTQPLAPVVSINGLRPGPHTLILKVPGGTTGGIYLDGFTVAGAGATPAPTATPAATPTPGTSILDAENNNNYAIGWGTVPDLAAPSFEHVARQASSAGARYTFVFGGNGIRWIGMRQPAAGRARVYLDGTFRGLVDLHGPRDERNAVIFEAAGLSNETHTMTIEAIGDGAVTIEYFQKFYGPAPDAPPLRYVSRLEESDAGVTYQGTWTSQANTAHSGGTAVVSSTASASADLAFEGVGVSWIGLRGPSEGQALASIDGGTPVDVETWMNVDLFQNRIHTVTGLPSGPHRIHIQPKGTASSQSTGTAVWIDAFEVLSATAPADSTPTASPAPPSTPTSTPTPTPTPTTAPTGTPTPTHAPGTTGVGVRDATVTEGQGGDALLAFRVELSQPASQTVTVDYQTQGLTATAGEDYVERAGRLVFAPGQTSRPILVRVHGDSAIEPNETLRVSLTNAVNATIDAATAVGTIVNDDPGGAPGRSAQYRLYSTATQEHLYTTDPNEYRVLGGAGWLQEGLAYQVFDRSGMFGGAVTIPLHRLYNVPTHQHHWTGDPNEVMVLAGYAEWSYEGVVGYVLASEAPGSTPLHRLVQPSAALHLWTTDAHEVSVLATPEQAWMDEGIAAYVMP